MKGEPWKMKTRNVTGVTIAKKGLLDMTLGGP